MAFAPASSDSRSPPILIVDDKGGFNDAALLYAAHWRIIDGLTLYGGLTHYYNLDALAGTVGLQLDAPHVGVAYAAGADSGFNAMENTIGVRVSSARYPSAFEGTQFAVLDLNQLLSSKTGLGELLLGGGGAESRTSPRSRSCAARRATPPSAAWCSSSAACRKGWARRT